MRLDLHAYAGTSFSEYVRQCRPEVLPQFNASIPSPDSVRHLERSVPTGTTILALKYEGGVVMGGDRRATEGSQIASNRIEKVYVADAHSAIAIAGTAGPCIELAKLFKTELEHYEKLEGDELTYEGKANKLAQMVREQFPMVFQGLVVVPIFAGYDLRRFSASAAARLFLISCCSVISESIWSRRIPISCRISSGHRCKISLGNGLAFRRRETEPS